MEMKYLYICTVSCSPFTWSDNREIRNAEEQHLPPKAGEKRQIHILMTILGY
jgi:hypothetical protein